MKRFSTHALGALTLGIAATFVAVHADTPPNSQPTTTEKNPEDTGSTMSKSNTSKAMGPASSEPTSTEKSPSSMSGMNMGSDSSASMSMHGSGKVAASDQMFFKSAAIGGMTEVEAGKLAADKGSTDEVKAFGRKMVDDHTKAGDELKTLAASKNITLPAKPDAKHQAMLDALDKKSGKDFDTAFIADMKAGHKDAIAAFTKASQSKDTDVASFASKTLPTLKEHQSMIPKA